MYYKRSSSTNVIGWVVFVIGVIALTGWINNILNIIDAITAPVTTLLILQCIGIVVPPLGAVLGLVMW